MTDISNSLSDDIKKFQGGLNQIEQILRVEIKDEKVSQIGKLARQISDLSSKYFTSENISEHDFGKMSDAFNEIQSQFSSNKVRSLSDVEGSVVKETINFLNLCLKKMAISLNEKMAQKLAQDLQMVFSLTDSESLSALEDFSLIKGNLIPMMNRYDDKTFIGKQITIIHKCAQNLDRLRGELRTINQSGKSEAVTEQRKMDIGVEILQNIQKIKNVEEILKSIFQ